MGSSVVTTHGYMYIHINVESGKPSMVGNHLYWKLSYHTLRPPKQTTQTFDKLPSDLQSKVGANYKFSSMKAPIAKSCKVASLVESRGSFNGSCGQVPRFDHHSSA